MVVPRGFFARAERALRLTSDQVIVLTMSANASSISALPRLAILPRFGGQPV